MTLLLAGARSIFHPRPFVIRRCISKKTYKFPQIHRSDVTEKHLLGGGPGGQNVNKSTNKIMLRHEPTGVVVFAHDTRSADENQKIAWDRLVIKVDEHVNGDNSYTAQLQREQEQRERVNKEHRRLRLELRLAAKTACENEDNESQVIDPHT